MTEHNTVSVTGAVLNPREKGLRMKMKRTISWKSLQEQITQCSHILGPVFQRVSYDDTMHRFSEAQTGVSLQWDLLKTSAQMEPASQGWAMAVLAKTDCLLKLLSLTNTFLFPLSLAPVTTILLSTSKSLTFSDAICK